MLKIVNPTYKPLMIKHLNVLMADADLYGCNAVWLKQIENSRVKWEDGNAKLEFCHTLVWHPTHPTAEAKQEAPPPPTKKPAKETRANRHHS